MSDGFYILCFVLASRRRLRRRPGELRGLRFENRGQVLDESGYEQLARALRHLYRVRRPTGQVVLLPAQRIVLQKRLRQVNPYGPTTPLGTTTVGRRDFVLTHYTVLNYNIVFDVDIGTITSFAANFTWHVGRIVPIF